MKKMLAVLAILAVSSCSQGQEIVKLDGTYTGTFYQINYPRSFKVTPLERGVRIEGGFTIRIEYQANPKSRRGSVMPLRSTLESRNTEKRVFFSNIKMHGLEIVKKEGIDEHERYLYALYLPLDGGLVAIEQEPAVMRQSMIDFSHSIVETIRITDFDWFMKRK